MSLYLGNNKVSPIITVGNGGGSTTIQQLNVSANGTYTASAGTAYSPVVVCVPTTSIVQLNATANQTYTAPTGTAYSPVIVNVPSSGGTYYYGMKNPTALYELNWSCKLSDTNFSSLTPNTSSQTLTLPLTEYTTTASTAITVDRWGSGYHNGTSMDLSSHRYVVLCETTIPVVYTTTPSGVAYMIKSYRKSFRETYVYKAIASSGALSSSWTFTTGEPNYQQRILYKNSSGTYGSTTTYGIYTTTGAGIGNGSTTASTGVTSYINFTVSTIAIRGGSSYHDVSAFENIDADQTLIKCHWILYECDDFPQGQVVRDAYAAIAI